MDDNEQKEVLKSLKQVVAFVTVIFNHLDIDEDETNIDVTIRNRNDDSMTNVVAFNGGTILGNARELLEKHGSNSDL